MIRSLASITLLATVAATQSDCSGTTQQSSAKIEQRTTEDNQQRLMTAIPLPRLQTSLERQNLSERLERINQQNMTGCIYLVNYGAVMAFYPVRGKVSSLNAYLTGQEKPVSCDMGEFSGDCFVESPDLDGAYGKNADGIFFFTADSNAYVEWHGDYLWSDQCLKLNQQPLMIRELGAKD